MTMTTTAIEIQGFSTGYGEHRLLDDVNAAIAPGTLTALLGRNGSGKSTLLRALAGLNENYTGTITVASADLRRMSARERAHALAYVTPRTERCGAMRVIQAVEMGRAPHTGWTGRLGTADHSIVWAALADTGMEDFADRLLDSLSDGERQRVMIARALAQDTPLILLDEPTSFLDLPNRRSLVALLHKLTREHGKTVLFSTHELDIALSHADNIAVIDNPHLHIGDTAAINGSGILDRIFLTPQNP